MVVEALSDPRRVDPPTVNGDEKASYDAWLDWHRITLVLKCEGLDDAGRKARPVTTSKMSLHGLVRHMAEVERGWFRRVIAQEDAPHIYDYSTDEDADFDVAEASWEDDLAQFEAEVDACRAVAAAHGLDHRATHPRSGTEFDLRWVYVHMIEEYARHNGHADLLRELVDGSVGD
jgi:uncharacterized damage-inducible protein DinB